MKRHEWSFIGQHDTLLSSVANSAKDKFQAATLKAMQRQFQKPTEELNFVREELNFSTEQLNYPYTQRPEALDRIKLRAGEDSP